MNFTTSATTNAAGYFSTFFEDDDQGPLVGRDPEMQISNNNFSNNNFISTSDSDNKENNNNGNYVNTFLGSNSNNPFASNDQANFIAEGSNNYEEYVGAPTATGYAQEVSLA